MALEIKRCERHCMLALVDRSVAPLTALGEAIPAAMARLGPMIGAHVEMMGAPFTRYLNDDCEAQQIEVGFAVTSVPDDIPAGEAVEVPGGPAASAVYSGPYEGLADAWQQMYAWVAASPHEVAGPTVEIYLTDPESEPDSSKWQTQLIVPLSD